MPIALNNGFARFTHFSCLVPDQNINLQIIDKKTFNELWIEWNWDQAYIGWVKEKRILGTQLHLNVLESHYLYNHPRHEKIDQSPSAESGEEPNQT